VYWDFNQFLRIYCKIYINYRGARLIAWLMFQTLLYRSALAAVFSSAVWVRDKLSNSNTSNLQRKFAIEGELWWPDNRIAVTDKRCGECICDACETIRDQYFLSITAPVAKEKIRPKTPDPAALIPLARL
jgi:hypothetical protein